MKPTNLFNQNYSLGATRLLIQTHTCAKRFLFCAAALLLLASTSQAQKIIALQNGVKTFFHQRLDTIMAHASAGDTIYLPGINYNYGADFIINKELHIYGVGHQPDSTLATGFSGIQNDIRFVTGSDNSSLSGVYIGGTIYFGTNTSNRTVSHVTISRNNMYGIMLNYGDADGSTNSFISILENIVRGDIVGGLSCNDITIERNIITHYLRNFVNPANTSFRNNIFTNNRACANDNYAFYNVSGVLIENNIVLGVNPLYAAIVNQCTFRNNLFYADVTFPNGANGTNTGSNNISNIPYGNIFVNFADQGCSYNYGSSFQYTNDYHLTATSPGKNAGRDGTDIGLFGSSTPYKAIPANPHVKTAYNSDNVIHGKLGVNVEVQAQSR